MEGIGVHESLRNSSIKAISKFLDEEKFASDPIVKDGVLEVINLISDYYEEGILLFPEVIITNDLYFFKTISNKEIIIGESELTVEKFNYAIKLCAPLAISNWVIFFEVKEKRLRYGLVNAELIETSLSLFEQTVGSTKVEIEDVTVIYLRNVGNKTVEITGLRERLLIQLTLEDNPLTDINCVQKISKEITKNCDENFRSKAETIIRKIIDEGVKKGRGNLIGVVNDDFKSISSLKKKFKDCLYLEEPIDILEHIGYLDQTKSNEASVTLRAYTQIMISMLNHDGVVIISDKARVLGYHMFVTLKSRRKDKFVGGARTRAYEAMINSKRFAACFYKSQDGNTKIWKKNG